ncbi:MAG: PLP-dependent aspartate aminotransferase family protein [Spirochaetaceae bacterium]
MKDENLQIETILAHLSETGNVKDPYGASHMPIYQTATFDLKKQGDDPYDYTRSGNPTRESLENTLAKVCGGLGCTLTHTGLGSVALLLETVLKANDSIIVDKDTYGGTFRLLKIYQERMNVTVHFTDFTNHSKVETILSENDIKLILVESPTNPGLKILDLKEISKLAKKYNTIFAVDNSLATFVSQRPLELGADFSLFSTTKYVSGHGSVIGGALVTNREDLLKDMRFSANAQGRSQNPMDVYIISLGIPTLPIRLEAHQSRALAVAKFLEGHNRVKNVVYPGLESHPGHELAKKQMSNFSGVMTVQLETVELAEKLVSDTTLFSEKCSFGTPDSRIEIPGKISHASFSEEELMEIGITTATVRISVGLENVKDLINDLKGVLD